MKFSVLFTQYIFNLGYILGAVHILRQPPEGVRQMLTIADGGGGGVSQMLTIADGGPYQ